MTAEEFVEVVKLVLLNGTVRDTIDTISKPPGRAPAERLTRMSNWYNSLSDYDKQHVEQIVKEGVDQSIFGFLCILDGVRAVEGTSEKGRFELYYVKDGEQTLINDPAKIYLHDLYNQ